MKKKGNIYFGIILIAIAIYVIIVSLTFPPFIQGGKKLAGPNFFPILLSIVLIVTGSYEIFITLIEKKRKNKARKKLLLAYLNNWGNQNVLLIILGLILYVPLLEWLGFALATFIFSLTLMIRLKTGWIRGTIFSTVAVIVIMLLFVKVFKVQLPTGSLGITF